MVFQTKTQVPQVFEVVVDDLKLRCGKCGRRMVRGDRVVVGRVKIAREEENDLLAGEHVGNCVKKK